MLFADLRGYIKKVEYKSFLVCVHSDIYFTTYEKISDTNLFAKIFFEELLISVPIPTQLFHKKKSSTYICRWDLIAFLMRQISLKYYVSRHMVSHHSINASKTRALICLVTTSYRDNFDPMEQTK